MQTNLIFQPEDEGNESQEFSCIRNDDLSASAARFHVGYFRVSPMNMKLCQHWGIFYFFSINVTNAKTDKENAFAALMITGKRGLLGNKDNVSVSGHGICSG